MKITAVIFFLIYFNCLQAQNDTLVFKQITQPFMPAITSRYFYFTQDGLMWFSTANGITSFDGSELVYYSTLQQANNFGLNEIICMAEDNAHNLYIKGNNHLIYFNRRANSFKTILYNTKNENITADVSISCIYINKDGLVYTGTTKKGLYIYNPLKENFVHINLTANDTCSDDYKYNSVKSFLSDEKNSSKLWLGTYNGIYLFDEKTKKISSNFKVAKPKLIPDMYDIRNMHFANDSTIWFSTFSSGIGSYNTNKGFADFYMQDTRIKEKKYQKPPSIRGFAKWKEHKYILGISDPNPVIFDAQSKTFKKFILSYNPGYLNIQYVSNDQQGNVWIMEKGLLYVSVPEFYYLHNTSIQIQQTKDYLANELGDIFFDKYQKLYYCSVPFSSGVYVLDTNISIKKIIPVPLYTNRYTYKETGNEFITKDSSGRVWTTCLGTYILMPGANKFVFADEIYPSLSWLKTRGETWSIATTRNGDILLLFVDGTVFHINQKTLHADSVKIKESNVQSAFEITTKCLFYDKKRNKVYVNNSKQLGQYDLMSKTIKAISSSVISGNTESNKEKIEYALDAKGFLWLWLPQYGIRIIDPDKLICIDSIANGTKGLLYNNDGYIRSCGDSCMLLIGQNGIVIYNYYKKKSLLLDDNNGWEHQYDYCKKFCNGILFINASNKIQYFKLSDFSNINHTLHASLNYVTASDTIFYTKYYENKKDAIKLSHYRNNITLSFSATEFFFPERVEYAYRLSNVNEKWQYTSYYNRKVIYSALAPGKYTFWLKAQIKGGNWNVSPTRFTIVITPAWWQTILFKTFCALAACILLYWFVRWRITSIRRHEKIKNNYEKELLELEAKALRAQMNPHFVFNCMNSIKSLIQKNEQDKAVNYLTTFSKLIRTIFQNSDKREISLFDEIETCRLYTQLESMRFENKFSYKFNMDKTLDIKSIMVPALIIQPFIENAIWHGIMPKEDGGTVTVTVSKKEHTIYCIIDDDGIGREVSQRNKFHAESSSHESKGVHLTQARLNLDNLLNEKKASLKVMDKNGHSTGTTVILSFTED